MLINRHNYEEFFLLYVDNELTVAERKAVEDFVQQNPDLEEELVMMMQSVLRPDRNIVFGNKESLLKNKSANGLVNQSNYEEYFVLYGDNELSNEEKDLVEQFVYKHPQYQAEFELIQQARFIPEHATLYPDKNELYRAEGDHRIIPVGWWKMAAAAIVVLMLGVAAWYMTRGGVDNTDKPSFVNVDSTRKTAPENKEQMADAEKAVKQPGMAVKEDKEEKKLVEEKTPAEDLKNNTVNVQKEKNIKKKSNIQVTPNVTQERIEDKMAAISENNKPGETAPRTVNPAVIETVPTTLTQTINVTSSASNNLVTELNNPKPAKEVIYVEYDNPESINNSNASLDKKPVRSLLRKVKGLFESKEDNNDPDRENKKGISIAAFEIARK
jgi:hypothetical protein